MAVRERGGSGMGIERTRVRLWLWLGVGFAALSVLGSCRHGELDEQIAKPHAASNKSPPSSVVAKVGEGGYAQGVGFRYPSGPKGGRKDPAQVRSMNAICAACHTADDHDMHTF